MCVQSRHEKSGDMDKCWRASLAASRALVSRLSASIAIEIRGNCVTGWCPVNIRWRSPMKCGSEEVESAGARVNLCDVSSVRTAKADI
jgi:hypothetical protein